MLRLFLGFGSNLGFKQENILNAYSEIEKRIGKITFTQFCIKLFSNF
jgi:7,8-dihydro-6-hydroxymethylpterin-pyrophosphokinase